MGVREDGSHGNRNPQRRVDVPEQTVVPAGIGVATRQAV